MQLTTLNFILILCLCCQTRKTVDPWKISGMLVVYWPIKIKFMIFKQTSKPQTNYRCCLRFSYLAPYWLISHNTITFHYYFWCPRFCEFHSKMCLPKVKVYSLTLYLIFTTYHLYSRLCTDAPYPKKKIRVRKILSFHVNFSKLESYKLKLDWFSANYQIWF